MCYVLKCEDFVDNDVSYVIEVLEKLCNPIMKEICWLMTEQSASHVLRSMICLLAGIPTIAERKVKLNCIYIQPIEFQMLGFNIVMYLLIG